jgi:phage gpG-like protein
MAASNMKSLEALQKVLDNTDAILDLVSTSVAEEAISLIKDGFRTETDPYGRKWEKKKFPDGRKTLSGKTSRLKNGWHVARRTTSEIVIAPGVAYAEFHQSGTGIHGKHNARVIPTKAKALRFMGPNGPIFARSVQGVRRRMMVPDKTLGLPSKWEQALNEAATDALAAIIGGDGRRVSALRKRLGVDAIVGFQVG